jgi:hypothetical protein
MMALALYLSRREKKKADVLRWNGKNRTAGFMSRQLVAKEIHLSLRVSQIAWPRCSHILKQKTMSFAMALD